jgi:hypothetical protein
LTPGSTPPESSLTTPVIAACANSAVGKSKKPTRTAADRKANLGIRLLLTRGEYFAAGRNLEPAIDPVKKFRLNRWIHFENHSIYVSKKLDHKKARSS